MKWRNHAALSFSTSLFLGFSPSSAVIAAATSNLPDQVEMFGGNRVLKHRGVSHEFAVWLFIYLILLIAPLLPFPFVRRLCELLSVQRYFDPGLFWRFRLPEFLRHLLMRRPAAGPEVWAVGPLFHLLGDAMTPGGIRFFGRKVTFRLFITGSSKEELFTAAVFLMLLALSFFLPLSFTPLSAPIFAALVLAFPLIHPKRSRKV